MLKVAIRIVFYQKNNLERLERGNLRLAAQSVVFLAVADVIIADKIYFVIKSSPMLAFFH